MLKGNFLLIGLSKREVQSKGNEYTFYTASLRDENKEIWNVDLKIETAKDFQGWMPYVDKELVCVFGFKSGKYSTGIELIDADEVLR